MYSEDSDSDSEQAGAPAPVAAPEPPWFVVSSEESQNMLMILALRLGPIRLGLTGDENNEHDLPQCVSGTIGIYVCQAVLQWRSDNGWITMLLPDEFRTTLFRADMDSDSGDDQAGALLP